MRTLKTPKNHVGIYAYLRCKKKEQNTLRLENLVGIRFPFTYFACASLSMSKYGKETLSIETPF